MIGPAPSSRDQSAETGSNKIGEEDKGERNTQCETPAQESRAERGKNTETHSRDHTHKKRGGK